MKKVFTQENPLKEDRVVVAPSDKTLEFLKQFARAYYVDKSLPQQVNSLCRN